MVSVPATLSLNVDAVPMQCMQCPTRLMQYFVKQDSVSMKDDAVTLQSLQCTCSATSSGCSVPAVVAVPPALSLNVDAVPMHCMQNLTRCMQKVVTEDAVPVKVDAVITHWLQCSLQCPRM